MKFLIVKLSAIGDVIHALPVASYLKRAVPGCQVSWLIEKASADLVSNNPAIDEVIVFGGKRWLKEFGQPGTWLKNSSEARAFFKGLRDAKYDAVLELQGLLKSSFLARASGAKVVAGFDDTREFADRFLTHKLDVGNYFGHDVPVVELNLGVAKYALTVLSLPAPDLPIEFPLPVLPSSVDVKVSTLLSSTNPVIPSTASVLNVASTPDAPSVPNLAPIANTASVPNLASGSDLSLVPAVPSPPHTTSIPDPRVIPDPTAIPASTASPNLGSEATAPINIVLIPGTTWVTKIWPEGKWIELSEMLADRYHCRLILVGGPAEIQSNYAIASKIEAKRLNQVVLNLTGQTSLIDLIGLFRKCSLVIGADTGPLHLAAATTIPKVVGVFGSTPAKRNGPYGPQCETVHLNLECQPCYSKTCKYGTVACLTDLASSEVLDAAVRAVPVVAR